LECLAKKVILESEEKMEILAHKVHLDYQELTARMDCLGNYRNLTYSGIYEFSFFEIFTIF
jgi:hypothetical protein